MPFHPAYRCLLLLALFALLPARLLAETDFESKIAPLLASRCVKCHNSSEAAGGLDLSRHAKAIAGGDSGDPAIAPGKPADSYLLTRIADGEMPPAKKGKQLTQQEQQSLSAWIAAGANWPEERILSAYEYSTDSSAGFDWWSLQTVKRPPIPDVPQKEINNPIDAFVLARLQAANLNFAPPAEKRALIRRVTFDLTGLPPTLEEIAAFLSDDSADAYEKLVERLLASPRYGERWARHWLDVAHYADTHGFERDFRRDNAWPYRDWVISAFNNDLPYHDFLRLQIAGDVIAPADPQAIIATGFLAAGPWDFVGHKENKDPKFKRVARADDLDDMATTVMTAAIGLTVNCSRCHDHKFDPIPQEDYYKLWAVFSGVQRGDRNLPASDGLDQSRRRLAELNAKRNALAGAPVNLADIAGGGNGFGNGKPDAGIDVRSGRPAPKGEANLASVTLNEYKLAEHPLVDGVFAPDGGKNEENEIVISSSGLKISGLRGTSGNVWDHIKLGPSIGAETTVLAGVDYAVAPHAMLGMHANKGITFDLAAIRNSTGYGELQLKTQVGYGGAAGNYSADFWIYLDGELKAHRKNLKRNDGPIEVDLRLAKEARFLTLISTDGGDAYSHDQIFFADPLLVHKAEQPQNETAKKEREELEAEIKTLQAKVGSAPVQIKQVYAALPEKAAPVHILKRGDTESPGKEVAPGTLSCLQQLSAELAPAGAPEGQRRLALANWIVDEKNPLTRRVLVNRLWHYHFGRGIVDTPSDFGFHGGRPSHPDLLDWLADELLQKNWSIKEMHRLICLSRTYRQAGTFSEQAAGIDADNRLLWRMSPRRLEAEAVRDAVLAISGKLNLHMGGPGYRDFDFIERYAPIYRYKTADSPDLWRRSVYRFTVRSVPDQFMEVLDCPNPSNLAPARVETTTALQSLALLNAPFMLKQAGYFAERIENEAGDDANKQLELAYQLAFGRPPTPAEHEAAIGIVKEQGLFPLCRALLNANEFMYVD